MFKRYTKRRGRKTKKITTKTVDDQQSKKIAKLEKIVKYVGKPEVKYIVQAVQVQNTAVAISPLFTSIAAGTGPAGRIGDTIKVKCIKWNFLVESSEAPTDWPQTGRIIIVSTTPGYVPTGANVLTGYTGYDLTLPVLQHNDEFVQSMYDKDKPIRVYYDKIVALSPSRFSQPTGATLYNPPAQRAWQYKMRFGDGMNVTYDNTGAVTKNGMYMLLFCGTDTVSPLNNSAIRVESVIYYTDM